MEKIIEQLILIIAGGVMALSFGCGVEELIDDLRSELNDDEDFAPTSLDGKTLHLSTNSASEGPTSGIYTITFTGAVYTINDNSTSNSGTYTYNKTASNQGKIVFVSGSGTENISLSFTSHTSGNYSLVHTAGSGEITGQETGTFIIN